MDAVITSRANTRVKALRAALERKRRDHASIAIEGPNLIQEAIRSGLELQSVFISDDKLSLLRELPIPASTQINTLSPDVFSSASATEHAQGIAALISPPDHALPEAANTLVLLLANLQDPGNMGTLIRSAEAFGAQAVVATPGTVDPWNQKSLRASAGSIFRVPVIEMSIPELKDHGFHLIAAVAREGAPPELLPSSGKRAIMIGNEGAGLSVEQLALAHSFVTIPCPGQVESLNAAIAGSVLLYAMSRQISQR